jgi:hypothetical protein
MEVQKIYDIVNQSLEEMGIKAEEAAGTEPGQWMLMRDEMPVYIDAWEEKESTPWNYFIFGADNTIFQITIPFCYGPTLKRNEFMEELMVVNLNLLYGKFSYNTQENVVALLYRIPGNSISPAYIGQIIEGLGYYAEMCYHVLKDEFSLKRVVVQED